MPYVCERVCRGWGWGGNDQACDEFRYNWVYPPSPHFRVLLLPLPNPVVHCSIPLPAHPHSLTLVFLLLSFLSAPLPTLGFSLSQVSATGWHGNIS